MTQFIKRNHKILALVIILTGLLTLSEPSLRGKLTFALTYFDHSEVQNINQTNNPITKEIPHPAPKKTRAPEPTTMFLFLGGMGGMVIRFAQKSFKKFKRAFDFFLAILGVLIASPIIIITGILIKLTSSGPVIYKQNRVGKNGEIFKIYKLRTMCIDAEKETGAIWAKKNDPRITKLGKVLRKTHLDEIPQLFNVLKGNMSIVGPRPERPEMVRDLKELICDYEKRLSIKPGITGMAQVWHKYDENIADVKKKIKYDILYIKKMCWLVDLRIMAETFRVMLLGKELN